MNNNNFSYEPAGAGVRFVAAMVDGVNVRIANMIINIPLAIIGATLSSDPDGGFAIAMRLIMQVLNGCVGAAYVGYFLSKKGATPGKSLFNIRVLHSETGAFVSPGRAVGRDLIGKSLCVLTLGIGFLLIIFRSDKRGLHDIIFKTRVVRRSN